MLICLFAAIEKKNNSNNSAKGTHVNSSEEVPCLWVISVSILNILSKLCPVTPAYIGENWIPWKLMTKFSPQVQITTS